MREAALVGTPLAAHAGVVVAAVAEPAHARHGRREGSSGAACAVGWAAVGVVPRHERVHVAPDAHRRVLLAGLQARGAEVCLRIKASKPQRQARAIWRCRDVRHAHG